jgi:anti-sigma regulatory factor (Ser/Thr protein kinase)
MAQSEGLNENAVSNTAIVATELSTNLLKHAVGGEIHLSSLFERGQKGIEILYIDRGPGINDLSRCLADGYSSVGTAGTGLGSVLRLASTFDVYSEVGRGTVMVSRLCARSDDSCALPRLAIGVISQPVAGETVSGDAWGINYTDRGAVLLLADGLGHGLHAADASGAAVSVFKGSSDAAPVTLLQQIHAALRGTRGAAVAVARLNYTQAKLQFGGIGNIAGRVIGEESTRHMVSHAGIAGHEARRFQEFSYELPASATVVLHSDGLTSAWNLGDYPGLLSRDPALIAAVLYRDATRGRDDVCVLVARLREPV